MDVKLYLPTLLFAGEDGLPGLPGEALQGLPGAKASPGLPGLPGRDGETGLPGDLCLKFVCVYVYSRVVIICHLHCHDVDDNSSY